MKKIISLIFLTFCISHISNAQIGFGVKGGINYNSASFKNVKDDILSSDRSKTGFHMGAWVRVKIPVIGLYIRPELLYTQVRNKVNYTSTVSNNISTSTDFNIQKIDVPVLIGKKMFGIANAFIGPSFQYIIDSDFGLSNIKEVDISNLSLGLQLGVGVELGKFGVDIRWERSLTSSELKFVDSNISNISKDITFDNRTNQIIIGLSYKL